MKIQFRSFLMASSIVICLTLTVIVLANRKASLPLNTPQSYVADGLLRQVNADGSSRTLHYFHRQFDGETGSWREDMHYLEPTGRLAFSDATICVVGEGLFRIYKDGSVIQRDKRCDRPAADSEVNMRSRNTQSERRHGVTGFWQRSADGNAVSLSAPNLRLTLSQTIARPDGHSLVTELTSITFQKLREPIVAPALK